MRVFVVAAVLASLASAASAQQAPPPPAPTQRPATAPPSAPQGGPARPSGQTPSQAPPLTPQPQGGLRPGQAPPAQPQLQPARPGTVPPPMAVPQASSWQNLKIDVKISDSLSSETQTGKVVSLYCADGRKGQVRSNSGEGLINVDVQPSIRQDGKIHLVLTIEYHPELTTQQMQQGGLSRNATFSESLDVLISDGRPMVLSQSADPKSERKVTVEVTATVVK